MEVERKACHPRAHMIHTSPTSSSDSPTPQRRLRRSPLRGTSVDRADISILHRDVMSTLRGRPELGTSTSTQAKELGRTSRRFRPDASDSAKNAKAPKRPPFSLGWGREIGDRPLSCIYGIFGDPHPKRGRNLGEVGSEDVSTPLSISVYRAPFACIGSPLLPTQEAAIEISESIF